MASALVRAAVLVLLVSLPASAWGRANGQPWDKATVIKTLPAAIDGTTAGVQPNPATPRCGPAVSGGVWYRFTRAEHATVVVTFKAGGDLDAVVSAYRIDGRQLKLLRCTPADTKGQAAFVFETLPVQTDYLLLVAQRVNSTPGAYKLSVEVPVRPNNDERAGATLLGAPPQTLDGTTLGATSDGADPDCAGGGPTVWYRLESSRQRDIVLRFHANGDLTAAVCVVAKARSQLVYVDKRAADGHGNAAFPFQQAKGTTYYVIVGQSQTSQPGTFRLRVIAPEPPPTRPGQPLSTSGARGTLDELQNPADAFAVWMTRGRTYRVTVLRPLGQCVTTSIYPPGREPFDTIEPVGRSQCGSAQFFTPGPDGGGVYSVLLHAGYGTIPYRLLVQPATADDTGPGVLVQSGQRRSGHVSVADPLDLYMFVVPRTSDVRILVDGTRAGIAFRLLDSSGEAIENGEPGTKLIRTLDPGTYHVAITAAGDYANGSPKGRLLNARYQLRVLIRGVTTTTLTANGTTAASTLQNSTVSLSTFTSPTPGGGKTRVQADFFDISRRTWVFRKAWDVPQGTTIAFTPTAVGQWRVRATFYGTQTWSPSRSDYVTIAVAAPVYP